MIVFDRLYAENLAALVQARLAASNDSILNGIQTRLGTTRYGNGKVTVTVEFTEAGRDYAREAYENYCKWFDLPADGYGRTITINRELHRIVGLATNRPKFPVDTVRVRDGKKFKVGADTVRRLLDVGQQHEVQS